MKLYKTCILYLLLGASILSSCSEDTDEGKITVTEGEIKVVATITDGFETLRSLSFSVTATPIPTSVTNLDTGDEDLILKNIQLPPERRINRFSAENSNSVSFILIMNQSGEPSNYSYTVEYYLNDKLEYTDRVGDFSMTTTHNNASKWSISDGFKRTIFSTDGETVINQ